MFDFFEKLKDIKIFEKFFSDNGKVVYENCTFNIISGNTLNQEPISLDKDKKEIIVNDSKLGESESEVYELIGEFSKQKRNRLLETHTNYYLEKLKDYDPKENGAIVEFFKEIISTEDYNILKSALFIIKQDSSEIKYLKRNLRRRYGDKGPRIVNLLNANYFSLLKEIYNLNINSFESTYEQMVTKDVLTIFVHNHIDIEEELKIKIMKFKTYKIKLGFIHIHGLGITNVEKIRNFVNNNSDNRKFEIKKIIDNRNVCLIEIYPN